MATIESLVLRCSDPQSQQLFYCNLLGMKTRDDGSVGYGGDQANIHFLKSSNQYRPNSSDTYWKIALAVENIDLAYQQLTELDIEVSEPRQFQDVGFLAHFTDPEGFTIELIEHYFKGNRPSIPNDTTLLGGGACFNLLTLRTAEIEKLDSFLTHLGMTPLSVQPVEIFGFTLYFYAFTTDVPPVSDLRAVENREWLYQRPYTVLEIQHVHGAGAMSLPPSGKSGYAGAVFTGCSDEFEEATLLISGRC